MTRLPLFLVSILTLSFQIYFLHHWITQDHSILIVIISSNSNPEYACMAPYVLFSTTMLLVHSSLNLVHNTS